MNAVVDREKQLQELTLKAAIIYDDFDLAARTAALLERAAARSDEAMQWDIEPWRLDLLQPSALGDAALIETADADLVAVALDWTHLPPDSLLDWLERWAERRKVRDAALLVLCPEETIGPMSSWECLKEFAEWQGLLFLGGRRTPEEEDSAALMNRLWRRKQPVRPTPPRWTEPPASTHHWGINE